MLLHELTHSCYRVGTVSPAKTVAYYAEAILLLRSQHHSAERLPNRTSTEFGAFILYRTLRHASSIDRAPTPKQP